MTYFIYVAKWNIIYYEELSGKCPVLEFIDSLKVANQAKVAGWLSLLEEKDLFYHDHMRIYFEMGFMSCGSSFQETRFAYYISFVSKILLF